jgi:elongator complex protein 6
MASMSRIPHLLEPYLALSSEGSLNLVTSVLGASSNWLLLRHVYSYLRGSTDGDESAKDTGVVLVSFMRDGAFWREGSTKLVSFPVFTLILLHRYMREILILRQGLDLDAHSRTGRFTFVDGLTGLYGDSKPQAPGARKERVLRGTNVADIKKEIEGAIGDLRASRKVLIIDQLDALLAVSDESTTSLTLQNLVLGLRSVSSHQFSRANGSI